MPSRLICLATVICLLAACSGEDASTPASNSQAASSSDSTDSVAQPAPGSEWDASQTPVAGATLTVTPNPVDFCTDKTQAVEVTWDVTSANPSALEIWLEDPRGERKLWVAPSVRSGIKTTGKWMQPNSKVIAVDAAGARILNTVTLAAADCDQ